VSTFNDKGKANAKKSIKGISLKGLRKKAGWGNSGLLIS
jgi:hypothetical protein